MCNAMSYVIIHTCVQVVPLQYYLVYIITIYSIRIY